MYFIWQTALLKQVEYSGSLAPEDEFINKIWWIKHFNAVNSRLRISNWFFKKKLGMRQIRPYFSGC